MASLLTENRTPTATSRGRKILLAAALTAGVLLVGVAAAVIFALNFDWNRARPWLAGHISEAIGRPFKIDGNLSLAWDDAPLQELGWHQWVPWPHLTVQDIRIGNPDWLGSAGGPAMAQIKQINFSLNPLDLLAHRIVVPVLRFEQPDIKLERDASGRDNWTFAPESTASSWKMELKRVILNKGRIHLHDALKKADLTADIDTINNDAVDGYGVAWQLHGTLNGETVTGSGKAGAVLSLQRQEIPYPLQATLELGHTKISAKGSLTKPSDLAALDMHLNVAGLSMARLYTLTGVVMPETPPYVTEGHLTGAISRTGAHWTYEKFGGKVGDSDLAGTLEFISQKPRGLLKGTVSSNVLVFKDLAPLIGADSNDSKLKRGLPAVQPRGKVLPVEPFKKERWTSIDADVAYSARKIIRKAELPIKELTTHLHLQNGVLTLLPLNFGVAGGNLSAEIKLDGNHPDILAEMKLAVRHLQLKQLFPAVEKMQASLGEVNGDAALSATGNSIAGMLGSSNGEVKALINQGTISKLLLEEMGLNIGNVVLSHLFGDKQVHLNCMAGDFVVKRGLIQTRSFVVDTDDALIDINGNINLSNENLDLTIKPHSKGLRMFSLRAPLYVTGTFQNPNVNVDKGVLAMRAGSAVALAFAAPFAALLPLAATGQQEGADCKALLLQANKKSTAPDPGAKTPVKKARPRASVK